MADRSAAERRLCGGRGRSVRFGQVHRLPAARHRARRALPRHRRDVPGGDLGGAARRRRPRRRRRRSPKVAGETELAIGTDPARAARPGRRRSTSTGRSAAPRSPRAVSAVAAVPAVRALLVAQQREIIAGAGRASWSRAATSAPVVAPDADLKVYLTASADARAPAGAAPRTPPTSTATAADLARRDQLDSTRAADPLRRRRRRRRARHHRPGHRRGRGAAAGAAEQQGEFVTMHRSRRVSRSSTRGSPTTSTDAGPVPGRRRRRPAQRRQVHPGQPHHRPPPGGRRGRARA